MEDTLFPVDLSTVLAEDGDATVGVEWFDGTASEVDFALEAIDDEVELTWVSWSGPEQLCTYGYVPRFQVSLSSADGSVSFAGPWADEANWVTETTSFLPPPWRPRVFLEAADFSAELQQAYLAAFGGPLPGAWLVGTWDSGSVRFTLQTAPYTADDVEIGATDP